MQQLGRRWRATGAIAAACAAAIVSARGAAAMTIDDQTAECLMQLFSGSDRVHVRSAIGNYSLSLANDASLSVHWNNEKVVVPAIAAPPGSQEAVDAITTASRPIAGNAFQDFVKVRNEFQGGVKKGHAEMDYYVSDESDYLGQQVAASYNRDLGGDQFNLSLGASYGWDAISPLADDDTRSGPAHKNTVHANAVATQVLGPTTMLRYGVELNVVDGLQHNPYRNVYAGGSRVPERHPDHRERRDVFLRLHQYLTNRSSLKFSYRFYDDSWGIDSHELDGKLSQYVTHGVFASYEYRYYTQSPASFYRPEYESVNGIGGYLTGDYRVGPLSSHLFGVALDVDLGGMAADRSLWNRFGLRCGYERYFNSNNYSADILTSQITYAF